MDVLVGTDSVHATAAICDYLEERAVAVDRVTVVGVASAEDHHGERDAREALNAATVRLGTVGDVETELREGEAAETLLEAADDLEADEIVVGLAGEVPDREVGSTVRSLLADASRPVVVVPAPDV